MLRLRTLSCLTVFSSILFASATRASQSELEAPRAQAFDASGSRAPTPGSKFIFKVNGQNFVYADSQRTFTGILLKPEGDGPFPAAIVSHGQGGSALGYSLTKARDFLEWDMVSIAPNYTHAAGGATLPIETGNCPENIARGIACLNVLKSLDFVDDGRIVLWGHSKGAYVTIGLAAAVPFDILAAGISAGGIVPDAAGIKSSAPTVSQASTIVTPFLIYHGDTDAIVPSSQSALLSERLTAAFVPHKRIVFQTGQHNLHQIPELDLEMLSGFHAWLVTHGVLR